VRERRAGRYERDLQETDHDECAPRHNCACKPSTFEGQQPGDEEAPYKDEDDYEHPNWGHQYSSPRVETKTVRFKNLSCSEEDRELDELIRHLHTLSVQDPEYASLYALSSHHFPDIVSTLPKPEY